MVAFPNTAALKIAILINHPPSSHFYAEIKSAFTTSFSAISPTSVLSFYDPIDAQAYPDPSKYDLVILSGGKADASASDPWILKMLEFIRKTGEKGETKMMGICWGHEALLRAFGGVVSAVSGGPVAGLVRISLTEEGRRFFPFAAEKGSYIASQFHVREVATTAEDFILLAENNECVVSKSNMMLGIQAHPEIGAQLAKEILLDEDTTYTEGQSEDAVREMRARVEDPQDGLEILERVVEWVGEK